VRNRTLSGMSDASPGLGARAGGLVGIADHPLLRPASAAGGMRPITPQGGSLGAGSFDRQNGQNFVDFNPAGEYYT